jgi:hypothetical protein
MDFSVIGVHEQETAAKWKGKDIDYVMDYFVNILN